MKDNWELMRLVNGIVVLVFGIGGSVLLLEKKKDENLEGTELGLEDHYMFADDNHELSDHIDPGKKIKFIVFDKMQIFSFLQVSDSKNIPV